MYMLIPYHVDVPMSRRPWMNWVIIGVTIFFYPLCMKRGEFTDFGERCILGEGSLGWIAHVLVHADIEHLLGNMLFLWVFGNAVCAKVGNLLYLGIYFGLGVLSGQISQWIDPRPSVGASGAINGVIGMFVVWYLLNGVSCWYAYWFFGAADAGDHSVSSYWLVLLWAVFDIWGIIRGGGNIGHVAHLAGFFSGFTLAIVLLKTGAIEMERGERSLLQVLFGDDQEEVRRPAPKRNPARRKGPMKPH